MSYSFYKVLHIIGILMIFVSFGAIIFHRMSGGDKKFPGKRMALLTHGIGMAVTLVAGFGLLARLGMNTGWPGWIWGKLSIWLVLGVGVSFALRKKKISLIEWCLLFVLGGGAAYLAQYKPF